MNVAAGLNWMPEPIRRRLGFGAPVHMLENGRTVADTLVDAAKESLPLLKQEQDAALVEYEQAAAGLEAAQAAVDLARERFERAEHEFTETVMFLKGMRQEVTQ